jgi:pimeloyl-ACP methyl ester carboxylesterase
MRISMNPRLAPRRLGRRGIAAAAACTAIAGTLLGVGLTSTADAATHSPAAANHQRFPHWDGGAKPTIVLVHGAWADSSSWNSVVEQLQALGFTVDVPPNPLRGVAEDSTYLSDFLSTISGPIVLVGHSYGGFVITNAATGNAQVKALVYDDAYIPGPADTLLSLTKAEPGSCFDAAVSSVFNVVPYPGGPSGDADLYVKQSVFPGCFANGLPAQEAAALAAEQRPLAASTLAEKLTKAPAWKTIPSWDIVGTADKIIPAAEQLAMAKNAGSRVTEIDAPHLSMISDPWAVTSVILQAAAATS